MDICQSECMSIPNDICQIGLVWYAKYNIIISDNKVILLKLTDIVTVILVIMFLNLV